MKKRHIFGVLFLLIVVGIGVLWVMLSHPRPEGKAGPEADALARSIEKAVNIDAWKRTGVIEWSLGERFHHLWDRKRQLSRVQWGKGSKQIEAMFAIATPDKGRVLLGGRPVTGPTKKQHLTHAYKRWVNDSFWLNPLVKLFDGGVQRKLVVQKGQKHLLVEYTQGGVTPGDAYFYTLGPKHLPSAWYIFASILPIKGMRTTFEDWLTLPTGARISTLHRLGILKIRIMRVQAADSLEKLYPKDPFAPLFPPAPKKAASRPTSAPAPSQPPTPPRRPVETRPQGR